MLYQEICELRTELNDMILRDIEYSEVYAVSIALDKLITQYYQQQAKPKSNSYLANQHL